MGSHNRFVAQTRQPKLSRFMRHVNGVHTQACNRRHGKVGCLLIQWRFKPDRTLPVRLIPGQDRSEAVFLAGI